MYSGGGILDDFKNAFNRPNSAHIQIIIINVVVFLLVATFKILMIFSNNVEVYELVLRYLQMPASLNRFIFQPWSIVTYFFLHEGFFHILFNMLFLFWFGRLVQDYLGSAKVISLYVLGGLMGGLLYMFIYNVVPFFQNAVEMSYMLGASAGVFAIVVGAATLMPNHTFHLLLFGPVRIKYIALFFVISSYVGITGSNAGGEIAHLGGAFIGYLFVRQLQSGNDIGHWVIRTMNFFKSFFVKESNIKVSYKRGSESTSSRSYSSSSNSSKSSSSSGNEQAEIDAILDKISEKGYESLTKEEKQKLFNASKK